MLESGTVPEMTNILLNGIGTFVLSRSVSKFTNIPFEQGQYGPASSKRPAKYQITFDKVSEFISYSREASVILISVGPTTPATPDQYLCGYNIRLLY
jgi:hypothetical protein